MKLFRITEEIIIISKHLRKIDLKIQNIRRISSSSLHFHVLWMMAHFITDSSNSILLEVQSSKLRSKELWGQDGHDQYVSQLFASEQHPDEGDPNAIR